MNPPNKAQNLIYFHLTSSFFLIPTAFIFIFWRRWRRCISILVPKFAQYCECHSELSCIIGHHNYLLMIRNRAVKLVYREDRIRHHERQWGNKSPKVNPARTSLLQVSHNVKKPSLLNHHLIAPIPSQILTQPTKRDPVKAENINWNKKIMT